MGAIIHFGTDGWRGRIGKDFTEENVARIADALGVLWADKYPGATVYVGYDTRPKSRDFALLAAQVLASTGLDVALSNRPSPAPAVSWAVAQNAASCGALIVTGSHHPFDYLGIKIRVADGGGGTTDFFDELEDLISAEPTQDRGPVREADLMTSYLDSLCAAVDAEAIREARLKVICDPMYGASRGYLSQVLRRLGVEVAEIHGTEEPGWEDFRPEPCEPWVDDCERMVVECGAQAGLITDGDADRVAAVDERGRYINPHVIIALLVKHLVCNRSMSGRVVLNQASSVLPRRVAQALDCRISVKPIGFKYLYEEMLKGDVLLGGEGAGGIGIPAHLLERDGMLCNLLLCEFMAMTGQSLGSLTDELSAAFGPVCNAQRDLRVEPEVMETLRTMLPGVNPPNVAGDQPVAVSHMDGLRLEFADESWLLLRPAGTEPVVRVYVEASTVERRDELLEAGCEIARGKL